MACLLCDEQEDYTIDNDLREVLCRPCYTALYDVLRGDEWSCEYQTADLMRALLHLLRYSKDKQFNYPTLIRYIETVVYAMAEFAKLVSEYRTYSPKEVENG